MFFGTGFDFNDDGVNDVYVFGRVRPINLPKWFYWVACCMVPFAVYGCWFDRYEEPRQRREQEMSERIMRELVMSASDARWLVANDKGWLPLNAHGLTTLSDDAAKALAQHQGDLYLNGVTSLSDDAAKALAQHQGDLRLNGVTSLSDEAAKALTQHKGPLYLDGLTTLSDKAANALRVNPDIWLPYKFKE